jgi:hypothetical protein
MAQTPQPQESGSTGETATPETGRPQGFFGSSTTILLLIFAAAVFWWSRRRRVQMEEQLREQRREAEATAERSALDVAHLMRAAPQPGAGAAATEGLASAAPATPAHSGDSTAGATSDPQAAIPDVEPGLGQTQPAGSEAEARVREIERAEASAEAERAAEEQAERAAQDSQRTGESLSRRMAAASLAAEEAAADTADAAQAGRVSARPDVGAPERLVTTDPEDVLPEPGGDAAVPTGAIAGDGTATCPPNYPIKANRQSRIFHRPGQVSYPSTIAEFCFASEAAAESAGYRQSRAREQRTQSQ